MKAFVRTCLVIALWSLVGVPAAHASGDTFLIACGDATALENAVASANATLETDTIVLNPTGQTACTYTTTTTLVITRSLVLQGNGATLISNLDDAIWAREPGTTLDIADLNVTSLTDDGIDIWDDSTATLTNVTIFDSNQHGLIVQNGSQAVLVNVTVSGNGGNGIYGFGGAIFAQFTTVTANGGNGIRVESSARVDARGLISVNNTGDECSIAGTFNDDGYNYYTDDGTCTGFGSLPANPIDPTLSANNSPVLTHRALTSTPIDAIAANMCTYDTNGDDSYDATLTTDARGGPRPFDGDGNGTSLCDAGAYEAPTLPAPPSDLTAVYTPTEDTITLTWADNATTEESYIIERRTDGSTWHTLATLPSDTTIYTDADLTCETTYSYRVKATNISGSSDYSNTAQATSALCLANANPTDLTAAYDADTNAIALTWSDNATTEESYIIERRTDGSTWAALATLPADTITYTDANLTCETTYSYRVKAVGTTTESGYSNTAQATSALCLANANPTDLTATYNANTGYIALTWVDNATTEESYTVERSTNGSTWDVLTATLPADTTTTTDADLTCGITYSYRVKAVGTTAESGYSNIASAIVPTCPPDGDPTTLTAHYDPDLHQVDLQWTDASTNETAFLIERQKEGAFEWVLLTATPANTSTYTDQTATCDQRYIYRVTATNASGSSQPATSDIVPTPCDIFIDIPAPNQPPFFEQWIEDFYQAGLTTGCNNGKPGVDLKYCPDITVDRGQMALFLLRAIAFPAPHLPTGSEPNPFIDVPSPSQPPSFEKWIEDFYSLGITTGCNNGVEGVDLKYCPQTEVNRGQMAVFILRAIEGPGYSLIDDPSDPFVDVPSANLPPAFEVWIEEFYNRGITTGCNNGEPGVNLKFCPETAVDRGQMAVFILRAFDAIPDPDDP